MIYNNKILRINKHLEVEVQTSAELSESILASLNDKKSSVFIHLNCCNYYDLKDKINTLKFPNRDIKYLFEGIGMKLFLAILLGRWLKDCNGTDSFPLFISKASKTDYRLFLLGATEEVIARTAEVLQANYPSLNIVGFNSGYFGDYQSSEIIKQINDAKADILIIGRGMEKELEFIQIAHSELKTKKIWCVGGLFDFVAQNKPRAPFWIRQIRLEWLFRIIIEPQRLRKIIKAGFWTFKQLLINRINHGKTI